MQLLCLNKIFGLLILDEDLLKLQNNVVLEVLIVCVCSSCQSFSLDPSHIFVDIFSVLCHQKTW
jgi:hypothetical protein